MLLFDAKPVLLFCIYSGWALALYVAHHDGKVLVWPPTPLCFCFCQSCASAAVVSLTASNNGSLGRLLCQQGYTQ